MTPQFSIPSETPNEVSTLEATCISTAQELHDSDKADVLRFLAARPLHTVVMSGFIRDNGLESWLNRGTFYACRDQLGELDGVALIGHAVFLEARSDNAIRAFARVAQGVNSHMVMGEQENIRRFWRYYAPSGKPARLFGREMLLVQTSPVDAVAPVPGLRYASSDDLSLIVPVHAAMALEQSGVDPLKTDAEGFSSRCARRIRQGRVWVLIHEGQLIFKADIISDTPEAVYLEGVYVAPHERGRGYGSRCLSLIVANLLKRTQAVVVLVDGAHESQQSFFQKVGFVPNGLYETIFLKE
jgi:predicted GNAT family acetyltransferase